MNMPSTGFINQPNLGCNIGIAQSGSGRQRPCNVQKVFIEIEVVGAPSISATTALNMPRLSI